jgi:hypothetical protein
MGRKKSKVQVTPQIEQGNLEPKPIEKQHVKIAEKKQELKQPAMLISRLNHPITVQYDKSIIRISPRGRMKVADLNLLGEHPVGLLIKKM